MWLIPLSADLGNFWVDLEKMNICKTVAIDISRCFIGTVNPELMVILVVPTTFFFFFFNFFLMQDLM